MKLKIISLELFGDLLIDYLVKVNTSKPVFYIPGSLGYVCNYQIQF